MAKDCGFLEIISLKKRSSPNRPTLCDLFKISEEIEIKICKLYNLDDSFINEYFGFNIPESLFDIDSNILNPKNSWDNQNDYENSAINLVRKFKKNYKKYDLGDDDILNGGPL